MPLDISQPPTRPLVAASILSADFARMEADCRSVLDALGDDAVDMLHLDVMDGHFVPNLTMGADMCRAMRRVFPDVFLDVHVMVTDPIACIAPFADAGADLLTFHVEPADPAWRGPTGCGGGPDGAGYDPLDVRDRIRASGMRAGLSVNPPSDPARFIELVPKFDLALVMSVNPGFSGQAFIPDVLRTTRAARDAGGPSLRVQMDGGVNSATAPDCIEAGCDVIVAASAIFGRPVSERGDAVRALRGR